MLISGTTLSGTLVYATTIPYVAPTAGYLYGMGTPGLYYNGTSFPSLPWFGDGTSGVNYSSPTIVGSGSNWVDVAIGAQSSTAIKSDGTLWSWGRGIYGLLGNGTYVNQNTDINGGGTYMASTPIQIGSDTTWRQVSIWGYSAGAIKTDGTLWMWGANYSSYGMLGTNNATHYSSPVQTVAGGSNWAYLCCGEMTIATKTNGTLWTWGRNHLGQLGDGTTVNKSSPVQVGTSTDWSYTSQPSSSGSSTYACAAIKQDGTLWLWGDNSYGNLGDNTQVNKSSPVQTVAGGTNWTQVNLIQSQVLATKSDGSLWGWGNNGQGQLGNATGVNKSSPVQIVSGATNWSQLYKAFQPGSGGGAAAAIKTDGTLWTWGQNNGGQLGLGDRTQRYSPTQVGSLTTWIKAVPGRNGALNYAITSS
jgi:alpha-tubulin suppressor-like RCC1 family protein